MNLYWVYCKMVVEATTAREALLVARDQLRIADPDGKIIGVEDYKK